MKTRNTQLGLLSLVAVLSASLLPVSATAQPTYRVTDLGSLLEGADAPRPLTDVRGFSNCYT